MVSSYLSNPILLGLFLVVGLVLLVKGADWLVDGASKLAKRLGVTDLVIGLTIVAFGTSMPEFVVNMVSVADGATDLAITNILGSNIINTLVILGCSALVCPLVAQRSTNRLVYAPTDSRLNFTSRYYAPILREELKELFALGDQVLEKRLAKMNRFEQAMNGNLLVECCVSADKQFVALQLKHFEQIDYQPISEVRFLQGDAAKHAAIVFDL